MRGSKDQGVGPRSVAVGLEVADKALVGNDAGFLESVHPLSDLDVDVAAQVGDGVEGLLKDHLVWDVFKVYLHVLLVGHWVIEVVVDDICRQLAGPFAGVGDDRVELDLDI